MLAVFNFNAKFCPSCGTEIKASESQLESKQSFTCQCGTIYQVGDTQPVLDAASKSGGDMEDTLETT